MDVIIASQIFLGTLIKVVLRVLDEISSLF